MYNWSHTDPTRFKNQDDREIWELEQLINFGLNGEKISEQKLRKHFDQLYIDPKAKQFLSLLLWNSTNSPQTSKKL